VTSNYVRYSKNEQRIRSQSDCSGHVKPISDREQVSANLPGTCSRLAYQRATVNVPVCVKPFTLLGSANTYCCDEPLITDLHCHPHGHKQICCFTVSQEICVEIPVHFGARVCAGESWVECHESSAESCADCDTK
jgi:hypothetical protein